MPGTRVRTVSTVLAIVAVTLFGGCGTVPAASSSIATGSNDRACDSNRDYAMTGVVHAMTQRERDDCRRAAARSVTP